MNGRQQTCEERITEHLSSRLDDLRRLWAGYTGGDCLDCEGTGEIEKDCPTCGGSGDVNGETCEKCEGEGTISETCETCGETGKMPEDDPDLGNLFEYGLAFDYVAPYTFRDQAEGYFRYQLSWGGPSDEFRIYADQAGRHGWSAYRIEYAFLDWFDGATRTLYGEDKRFMDDLFQSFFVESETATVEYDKAMQDYEPQYPPEDEEDDDESDDED